MRAKDVGLGSVSELMTQTERPSLLKVSLHMQCLAMYTTVCSQYGSWGIAASWIEQDAEPSTSGQACSHSHRGSLSLVRPTLSASPACDPQVSYWLLWWRLFCIPMLYCTGHQESLLQLRRVPTGRYVLNAGPSRLCSLFLGGSGQDDAMQWHQLWALLLVGRECNHVSFSRPQAWPGPAPQAGARQL